MEYLEPDLILISVAKKYLARLPLVIVDAWQPVHVVQRPNPYVIEVATVQLGSGKRARVVFGRAAQLPFGTVSKKDKQMIGMAIKEHGPA